MSAIDLKALVSDVLDQEWNAFAQRHPNLARVVDRQLMIEQYADDLRSHPEFAEAMRQVESAGLAHETLQGLARKIIALGLRLV